jgi:hypothetical protein
VSIVSFYVLKAEALRYQFTKLAGPCPLATEEQDHSKTLFFFFFIGQPQVLKAHMVDVTVYKEL